MGTGQSFGVVFGVASALFYAFAYTLRGVGLTYVADPAFGTCVGALIACLWFPCAALVRGDPASALRRLVVDRGRWQWAAALALSLGQLLQFFALSSASVAVVAVLGSLDVLFAALFTVLLTTSEKIAWRRLILALVLALGGTAILIGQ